VGSPCSNEGGSRRQLSPSFGRSFGRAEFRQQYARARALAGDEIDALGNIIESGEEGAAPKRAASDCSFLGSKPRDGDIEFHEDDVSNPVRLNRTRAHQFISRRPTSA